SSAAEGKPRAATGAWRAAHRARLDRGSRCQAGRPAPKRRSPPVSLTGEILAPAPIPAAACNAMNQTAVPVFDAHVDSLQLELDLAQDLGRGGDGHLDLVRARAGGLATAVFVSWVDPTHLARDA